MATKYFTYRPLYLGPRLGTVPLDYHLKKAYGTLKFDFELAIANGTPSGDGRELGSITADTEIIIDAVLQGLPVAWEEETKANAQEKVKRWKK
jgi:hypothetical protein